MRYSSYTVCIVFCIHLTPGKQCIHSNNTFLNSYNTLVNYGEDIIAWKCLWEALHKQVCLICTSFQWFWGFWKGANVIGRVRKPLVHMEHVDWSPMEGDRASSWSILCQMKPTLTLIFSHKHESLPGRLYFPRSPPGWRVWETSFLQLGRRAALSSGCPPPSHGG